MARLHKSIIFLISLSSILSSVTSSVAEQTATDRSIALYQAKAATSKSVDDYDRLGAAYIQKGRETSDFAYFDLAEKTLAKSLALTSSMDMSASSPLTHMAATYMAEHRFEEAADYAQRALALGSGDLSPFGLLGDAHADLGKYDQAAQDYEKLLLHLTSQGPSLGLVYMHDSRVSYLKFIRGDNAAAIELSKQAVNTATALHMPAENVAWTDYQLGEYLFLSGDLAGAEAAYQESLHQLPDYYRGLAGMGKVLVAKQKYTDAIIYYRKAIEEIPFPDTIAALGDIYTKLRQGEEAKKQYDLVEFIGYLSLLNQRAYNRELAVFYADRDVKLPQSLELAQRELELRRDVYTQDVLAWSLYKNGQIKQASATIEKVLAIGTKDAMFYYHAGMIHRDLGDVAGAREYLGRALAINPQFHIFYADAARQALEDIQTKQAKLEGGAK